MIDLEDACMNEGASETHTEDVYIPLFIIICSYDLGGVPNSRETFLHSMFPDGLNPLFDVMNGKKKHVG